MITAGAAVEDCGHTQPGKILSVGTNRMVFRELAVRVEEQVTGWVADALKRHGRIDVGDHYGDQAQFKAIVRTIPAGHLASPDIGAVCAVLASTYSRPTTDAGIDVDGGGEWAAFLEHTPNVVRPS